MEAGGPGSAGGGPGLQGGPGSAGGTWVCRGDPGLQGGPGSAGGARVCRHRGPGSLQRVGDIISHAFREVMILKCDLAISFPSACSSTVRCLYRAVPFYWRAAARVTVCESNEHGAAAFCDARVPHCVAAIFATALGLVNCDPSASPAQPSSSLNPYLRGASVTPCALCAHRLTSCESVFPSPAGTHQTTPS